MSTETGKTAARPWYKQFWPWFIMALPATAVVAGLTTVGIAVKNQDSVVRDDWYNEGKAINRDFARDDRAKALGLKASARIDSVTGEIRVTLEHKEGMPLPQSLNLYFQHPTRADADEKLVLARQGEAFQGHLPRELKGRFYVELGTSDWRLQDSLTFPAPGFTLAHD